MTNEHLYIFEQMRRDAVDDALAYFNLGEGGPRQTCFVYGVVRLVLPPESQRCGVCSSADRGGEVVRVILARGRQASDEFEWLRSAIALEWESNETALIEIPVSFVTVFGIAAFVQDADSTERHRRYVEQFNAPKLAPPPVRKLETIAGVRI